MPCVRRRLMCQFLAVLMVFAVTVPLAQAQEDGSPVAGETIVSPTREAYKQQLREAFPFEEPQQTGGQVIASGYDPFTINPLLASDDSSFVIVDRIYESLVAYSPVDGLPVPGLADRWELAPDRVTYTFFLNPDARWHDGADFTAEDVQFTYDALLNPETGSAYTTSMAAKIASHRVIDPDTFEIVASEPFVTFPFELYTQIMPKHLWENVPPADWPSDPGSTGQDPGRVVGTGPFTFQEWIQGERIVLARNDAYWDDVPVIDELVFQVMPDAESEIQALKTGEIDIVDTVIPARVDELAATAGLAVTRYEGTDFAGLMFNLDPEKTPLLQEREVRQALMYALDREAINEVIFYGLGVVAVGMQPPVSPAYAPEHVTLPYPYDPDQARQLLTDAGWTDSNGNGVVDKDGIELNLSLLNVEGDSGATWEQLVSYLQEAWRAIGVGLEIEAVSGDEWYERTYITHDFELIYGGMFWDFTGDQGILFRCDAYGPDDFNIMRYCNPHYDELDDLQKREFDPERRLELMIDLNNIVTEDLPVAPLRFPMSRTASSTQLHNYFPNSYGGAWWSLPYTWVEQA